MQFLHNFLFLLYQTSLWLQNINKLFLRVKVTNDLPATVYALFICGRRSALYNIIYGIMSRLTASSIGFWRNSQCCVSMPSHLRTSHLISSQSQSQSHSQSQSQSQSHISHISHIYLIYLSYLSHISLISHLVSHLVSYLISSRISSHLISYLVSREISHRWRL